MATPAQVTPPGRARWLRPATPLARGQLVVLLVLIVLTTGAWWLTVWQTRTMDMPMGIVARGAMPAADAPTAMGEMDDMGGMAMDGAGEIAASGMAAASWSLSALATFVVAWAVMMTAMMFPAAAPMLLLFQRVAFQRPAAGGSGVATWLFAVGYLVVWTLVGALTWGLVQVGSALAGRLGAVERTTWAPLALGGVLVLAGLYQLTPLKRVCLNHCRNPLSFVMTHWRDGRWGALRMGVVHGLYCLGCCWALFTVLVAAGIMSLAWMLLLTLVVFAEKVLPLGRRTALIVGVAFLVLGVVVASGTANLPWGA